MQDYNDIRNKYFQKRCKELEFIAENRDMLSFYNTALIDKDTEKLNVISNILKMRGISWNTNNCTGSIINRERLKIIYLLPHSGITGGMKIIIEQANRLSALGHDVLLYSHSPKPVWMECKCPYFTVSPDNNIYHVTPCADIVIAGYWDLVVDALKVKAPLKYHFAQGDYDIFKFGSLSDKEKRIIGTAYTLPLKILTVSNIMVEKLDENFGRKAVIIPNAIDSKIFHKKKIVTANKIMTVLLVGSDTIAFKNHKVIIEALSKLQKSGYVFKVKWITQLKLVNDYSLTDLCIEEYVAPKQKEIGEIYRTSDLFICASAYESFALPVLEAMSCGTPVITSDNGGINDYCIDNVNSLIFNFADINNLIEKIMLLYNNTNLIEKLVEEGYKTAKKYNWTKSTGLLDKVFKEDAQYFIQATKL